MYNRRHPFSLSGQECEEIWLLTDLLRGNDMIVNSDSDYTECFLNFLSLRKFVMKEGQNESLGTLIVKEKKKIP
jgi:hypothetical protein